MIDYKLKYLKYKSKYLNARKFGKIDVEILMQYVSELYQLVESNFEEVYITGSMAILALAYFLDKNMIPNDYPVPNDIDFIVFQKSSINTIKIKQIGVYTRGIEERVSNATFTSESTDNYFNSFDIISKLRPSPHHVINFNGNNIKIYKISSLKKEYSEDLNVSDNKKYDEKKIMLINKIEKYYSDRGIQIPIEFNKNITDTERSFTFDLAQDLSSSSDDELVIPRVERKLF